MHRLRCPPRVSACSPRTAQTRDLPERQGPPGSPSAGSRSQPTQEVFALAGSSHRSLEIASGSDLWHQEAQLSSYTQSLPAQPLSVISKPADIRVGLGRLYNPGLNLSAGASFHPLNPWSVEKCPWTWPCHGGGSLSSKPSLPPLHESRFFSLSPSRVLV